MKHSISDVRRFFDPATANAFQKACLEFRFFFNELAVSAIERGLPRYHMRPKIHLLEHVAVEFWGKNPKYYMNYLGEDAVRRVKALASASPARFMAHHVLYRYCVQMALRLR